MADAAVAFLLKNLRQVLVRQVRLLSQGEDVVRVIEDELENVIPLVERAEAMAGLSREVNDLAFMIHRAEDLIEAHSKWAMRKKNPFSKMRVWSIRKQLHIMKDEITRTKELIVRGAEQEPERETDPAPERETDPAPEREPEPAPIPSHLKRCVHYLLLFPPHFVVPTRRLIGLWVAEGLVRSNKNDNDESVEQIAERYLNELIDLKVLLLTKRNLSGKVKACILDEESRDDLLNEATKANFFKGRMGKKRRLVDCDGYYEEFVIRNHGNSLISETPLEYRDVISFLCFNTQASGMIGEVLGDFLRKCISAGGFIWLRVLDFERVNSPKLPNTLGKLICLKYLGLRYTSLEQIPDSVNRLQNLQVLDLKHTYISVLPRSIWSMQYLRHLYLSEVYRTKFPVPQSPITLNALQTLWGAFVDEDTCVVQGLDTSLSIRKLGLSCRSTAMTLIEMSLQLKAIDQWISKLDFLESLRLKSRDAQGKAANLHLTSLKGNTKLSTLYLLGKLHLLDLDKFFPVSLADITLSGSELDLDPLPFLGELPNLLTLRLLGQSVVCLNMYCSEGSFSKLQLLWIWKLENLEEFHVEEGSLPCLENLEIRSCHKLGKLPDQLQNSHNLEIKLTRMPPEFVDEAKGRYTEIHQISGVEADQYIFANTPTQKTKGKSVEAG